MALEGGIKLNFICMKKLIYFFWDGYAFLNKSRGIVIMDRARFSENRPLSMKVCIMKYTSFLWPLRFSRLLVLISRRRIIYEFVNARPFD